MSDRPETGAGKPMESHSIQDLEELCKVHSISLELIRRSHNLDDLLDVVLDELENRLAEIPGHALGNRGESMGDVHDTARLKALVTFTSQAAELKVKAEFNRELQSALDAAEADRERLDGVMASIAAGIAILDRDGKIVSVNNAMAGLVGRDIESLEGDTVDSWVGKVEAGGDGEIQTRVPGEGLRVRLISRRNLKGTAGGEVLMMNDITERDRIVQERHYKEKMHGLMQTIGMLTHQINNPLTSLLGRAQILRMKSEGNEDVLKAAGVIEESARRIAGLIQDLSELVKIGDREELEDMIDRGLEPGQIDRRKP
ncbi:MAG: PAS domain-containing protein [Acidobacteria bacterium]|uniref:histidine kinase n=1 Tax=Candidatus Polarisedimenticola svalbardensis TaxID=2886004 RepID=A0A8J6XS80_9BACT|nr:PAS domain-containing protein [Candidatus Polarisedimenticola svalbardensis]